MKSGLKELEESIRKLEELRKSGKNVELAANVESGMLAIEGIVESKAFDIKNAMDSKFRELERAMSVLRRDVESAKNFRLMAGKTYPDKDDGEVLKSMQKNYMEMKSRVDVLQKYLDGKLVMIDRKIDSVSKFDSQNLRTVANEEKKIDENLKIFALNSDVEKVWKELDGLKRYMDEKYKGANALANSLRVWETRNMQVMEKEHDLDEKLKAFPELKLLEGRIRKLERAIVELQKHFVAAQIAEPIIME